MTKKYIVTQSQLQTLFKIIADYGSYAARGAAVELYSKLKPVEPITIEKILDIGNGIDDACHGRWLSRDIQEFGRAIERHIIGELK